MSRRSPQVAAALSFLFPGLGQLVSGHRRRSIAFALPAFAVLLVALLLIAAPWSPEPKNAVAALAGRLLSPGVLAGLLILDLVALVIHLVSVADAYAMARSGLAASARGARRVLAPGLLIVLVGLTVGIHAGLGYLDMKAASALDSVFGPSGDNGIPDASFDPTSPPPPGTTPSPSPTLGPTDVPVPKWAQDGRLDLLLIGGDAGVGRWSLRTDSMMVLSVDIATGRAALFGIPRNLVNVPLAPEDARSYPNGRFPGLLNALYVEAMGNPSRFPGGDNRGMRAVAGAIQELVGIRLDGLVGVDLQGFAQLVDSIGGLWIDVPQRVVDDRYPLENGKGYIRLDIKAGCQKLNGRYALAFARSRHMDSDYQRMGRQQLTLQALRRQLDPVAMLPQIPDLISNVGEHLWTTIDRADIAGLVDLASRIHADEIQKVLFVPPTYPEYVTKAEIAKIRSVVRGVFDHSATPSPSSSPSPTSSASPHCGA